MFGQPIHDGSKVESRHTDPVGQCRAVNVDTRTGKKLALAIQRAMVRILADQHVRDGAFGWEPALDQPRGRWCLCDTVGAGAAGVFGADRHDHTALRGDDVEPLVAILADPVHLPAAAWAHQAVRLDHTLDARQTGGQVAAIASGHSLALGRVIARSLGLLLLLSLGDGDLEILEGQLTTSARRRRSAELWPPLCAPR